MRQCRLASRGICSLTLIAGIAAGSAQAQTVTVNGGVRDATTSRPLLGAVVTLSAPSGERATRTDQAGAFVFGKVGPGSYTIAVRLLGYEPVNQRIQITDGTEPIVVTLSRLATLDTVRVRAAQQAIYGAVGTAHELRPIPGAVVYVVGSGGRVRADSTGHFFVAIKTPGSYIVRAQAEGFEAQTVSVTVSRNEGVEVAMLLDSATGPASHVLTMAYADFDERLRLRRGSSALVPRTELVKYGSGIMLGAIRSSPSFVSKTLRFDDTACVFIDGRPAVGVSLNAIDPTEAEAIETYTAGSDASGTLALRWPRGMPCVDTGVPRPVPPGRDLIRWVVIWLKR